MTRYNTLKVKLSNLQLCKLKSGKKNDSKVALNLSSNVIGNFHNKTNFPHKSSAKIKSSKTQLHKIGK